MVECHYTTGGMDLFVKIYAHNNHHLLEIIHDKLQPLGLSRTETIISFKSAIYRSLPCSNLETMYGVIDTDNQEDKRKMNVRNKQVEGFPSINYTGFR